MLTPRSLALGALLVLASAARPAAAQTTDTLPINAEPAHSETTPADSVHEPETKSAPAKSRLLGPGVHVLAGPRVGGLVPFSRAGLTYDLGIELGAQLLAEGKVGLVVELGYRQPTRSIASTDLRLPSGAYDAKVTDSELSLFVGPRAMFEVNDLLVPFGAIGLGAHFIRSTVEGSSGTASFGETHEQSTQLGLGLRGGLGLHLGPGLATATLALDLAPLDHFVTGDTRTSGLSLALAYLFVF